MVTILFLARFRVIWESSCLKIWMPGFQKWMWLWAGFVVVILDDFQSSCPLVLPEYRVSCYRRSDQPSVGAPVPPGSTPASPFCSPQVQSSECCLLCGVLPTSAGWSSEILIHGKGKKEPFESNSYLDGYQVHSRGVVKAVGWRVAGLSSMESQQSKGMGFVWASTFIKKYFKFRGERGSVNLRKKESAKNIILFLNRNFVLKSHS